MSGTVDQIPRTDYIISGIPIQVNNPHYTSLPSHQLFRPPVMKFSLSKLFRKQKSALRKHSSQPSLSNQDYFVSTTRTVSSPRKSNPGFDPRRSTSAPRRTTSYTTTCKVNLEPFVLPTPPAMRPPLLPASLMLPGDSRGSFTTCSKGTIKRSCRSFVRKMCQPRSLPTAPRLTPHTLSNGAIRRSLPDLASNIKI